MKKVCSIVWDGLKEGPRYSGKAPELKSMTEEFLAKHKTMDDPEKFGQAMRDFAEERGFEVEDNVYLDTQLHESLSASDEKEFIADLRAGKVEFKYKKVDGSTREALGTLNPDVMNLEPRATDKKMEGAKKKHFVPPTIIVYFDLDAKGFRSFRKDNFISWKKPEEEDKEDKKKDKKED